MSKARIIAPSVGPAIIDRSLSVPLDKFSNSYDENYRQGYSQGWNRSDNQSGLEQVGYGLLSRTLSILPKIGSGLGSIYGLGSAVSDNDLSKVWDNPVNDWFNSLDEGLREALPVYQSRKYDTSGLFGKLTTTSFWANDAFDGLAYAASAFVPGAFIGKGLQAGSAVIKSSDLGRKLLGGLNAIGVNAKRANLALSTAYNTISESAAEAYQTQKELEAIYVGQGYDGAMAKQKAAEGASRVFKANLGALIVPNLVENTFFHGGWNSVKDDVYNAVWARGAKGVEDIKYTDSLWKKIGGGLASEGFWEENIQTSLQQWERNAANTGKGTTDNRATEIALTMANNVGGFFNSFNPWSKETPDQIEGATSIFLGGLIGGVAAARSYKIEKDEFNKHKDAEINRKKDLVGILGETAAKTFVDNVGALYKTKGTKKINQNGQEFEVPDYELDEQGNPILDHEALNKFGLNALRNKHLWDAQALAGYRNDPAMGELNKQMALASFVTSLATSKHKYTPEEIDHLLDQHAEIGTEEAKALGINSFIKENMDQAKAYAKQFQSIKEKRGSVQKSLEPNLDDQMFDDFANKTEFYLNVKRKALENISKIVESEAGKETVSKLIEDTDAYLNEFNNDIKGIRKEYDNTVISRERLMGKVNNDIKQGKTDDVIKGRYKLAEDAYINGDWQKVNSSAKLTTQEAKEGTKIAPGSKDFYAYNSGKSLVTVDRVAKALEAKDDILDIATQFNDGLKVVPKGYEDVVAEQRTTIQDSLAQEEKMTRQQATNINSMLGVFNDMSKDPNILEAEEPVTIGDAFAEHNFSDEDAQGVIGNITELGSKLTLDSDINELFNSPEFFQYLSNLNDELIRNHHRHAEIIKQGAKLQSFEPDNGFIRKYEQAQDKEKFLKEDYYNTVFGDKAKNFIKAFEGAKEDFMDDQGLAYHISNLKAVVLGTDLNNIRENAQEVLDTLINEVSPQISKNINNQLVAQANVNHKIVSGIVNALPFGPEGTLEKALSKEAYEYLNKLRTSINTGQTLGSFDTVITLLGHLKSSNEEVSKYINELLLSELTRIPTEALDKLIQKVPVVEKLATAYKKGSKFSDNLPYTSKRIIVEYYEQTGKSKTIPAEIMRFLADMDFFTLMESARRSGMSNEEIDLVNIIGEAFFKITGIQLAQRLLQSDIDTGKLLKFKEILTTPPSLQQNIALTQAITFLQSGTTFDGYGNWLIVRGIGGSGKTHFLATQLLNLQLELSEDDKIFYAFSKEPEANENIRNAVGISPKEKTSFELFLEEPIENLKKVAAVIIDEVFTFTNEEIQDIQAKAKQAGLKVIALGDPSQLTAEKEPMLLSTLKSYHTLPLTTSYRTNVSAISSFLNNYRLSVKFPVDPVAVANTDSAGLLEDPSKAVGVISTDEATIFAALEKPSTRRRVLIVPTQEMVTQLKPKMPKGVDIKTPTSAQGIQWDEVYSVLPSPSNPDAFESNRVLYTAYSRAKTLLVVADGAVINSDVSTTMDSQIKDADKQLADIADMFHENIQASKKLEELLGLAPSIVKDELEIKDDNYHLEPVTDTSVSGAMSTEEVIIPRDPIVNESPYELLEPSNFGVVNFNGDTRLAKGSKAYFLKTQEGNLWVIGKNQHSGQYFKLALISRADFENPLLNEFLNNITRTPAYEVSESEIKNKDEFDIPNIDAIAAGNITISDFLKFKTIFGPNYYFNTETKGDIIEDMIIKFYTTYYRDHTKQEKPWVITTTDKKGKVTHKVEWKNIPDGAVTMTIPTKKDVDSASKSDRFGWKAKYHNPLGLNIFYGIPYLIIRPSETAKTPILIRMQPKNLSVTHPYVGILKNLLANIEVIEEGTKALLGSPKFEEIVTNYKDTNYTVKDKKMVLVDSVTPTEYGEAVDLALQKLVESISAPTLAPKEFRSEENANEFLTQNATPDGDAFLLNGERITGVDKLASNRFVLISNRDATDKETTAYYSEYRIESGHGTAQRVLNSIAKANNRIDGNLIRQSAMSSSKAGIKISRSPSILLSKEYTDYHGLYNDPEVRKYFTEAQINKYLDLASDPESREGSFTRMLEALSASIAKTDGIDEVKARGIASKMVGQYTTAPISSALLKLMVGDAAFDADGRHVSLRTPLYLNTPTQKDENGNEVKGFKKTGINDLGENLANQDNRKVATELLKHAFDGIQRTQVFFTSPELADIAPPVKPKPESVTTLKEVLEKVPKTNNPVYDSIVELLRRVGTNASILYLPDGIEVKKGNETKVYAAGSTTIVDGIAVIQGHAIRFDNVDTDTNQLHLFLHEAMHAASKQALAKGKQDSRKGIDSKEALLYRRMISIKKRFDSAIRSRKNELGERLRTSAVYQETFSKLDVDEFVANLANPTFVEFAKSVSLVPSGTKKSLLREILEAIVNYFKDLLGGNPSVYDAALASLEEYYSMQVEMLTPVTPSVIHKPEDLLADLTAQIENTSEFEFDHLIGGIKAKYGHIIDVASLPEAHEDTFELGLRLDFINQSPETQSVIIGATKSSPSGAWFKLPEDKMYFTPGSIETSYGITTKLDSLIPDTFNKNEKLLLKSIIRISAQEESILGEIAAASKDELVDLLYRKVFSNLDKANFRTDNKVGADEEVKDLIKSGEYLAGVLEKVQEFVLDNYDTIDTAIDQSKDQGSERYRIAKGYVESLIKENLQLDRDPNNVKIMKTPLEIREFLDKHIATGNPVLPSGLTFAEAGKRLSELYKQPSSHNNMMEIRRLETELSAIKSLSEKDQKTRKPFAELILKDIYPNTKFAQLQDFETELYELVDEGKFTSSDATLELAGISEYIKKYDQSYENTLSESLKNSFRRITLGNKSISPGLAYIKTLQIVQALDWNLEQVPGLKSRKSYGLDYLAEQLAIEKKATSSELTRVIIEHLIKTISDAKTVAFFDGVNIDINPNYAYGIISYKAEDNVVRYAAYKASKEIPRAFNLTYLEIENLKRNGADVKLLTKLTNSSNDLYSALAPEGFSIQQYNRLFVKGEASNVCRALKNTMGSMKETLLYTANRSNKKGLELRFQRNVSSGVSFKYKDQLTSNLIALYEENRLESLNARFMSRTEGGKTMSAIKEQNKYQFIKFFFNELGIDIPDFVVKSSELNDVVNDITAFLQRTNGITPYSLDDEQDDSGTKFDILEWLESSEGVDGYLNRFSKIMSSSDRLARNPSVRDAYGNKFYVYHESSHFYDVLDNLINVSKTNPVFRGGSGTDETRSIPEFIKSDYYDHNIFVRGAVRNRLHSIIEIDGSRNLGNDSVTEYSRENMFFFFQRNFNHQFIDAIRQFKGSYFQSTFVPADSPKALAVRVNILSDNGTTKEDTEIYKSIELIFKQLLQKQNAVGAPYTNFDDSNKNDLFRNFKFGERAIKKLGIPLTEKNIPRLARYVYDEMAVKSEELLKQLTNSDVKLTLDINTYAYAKNVKDKMNVAYSSIVEGYDKVKKAVSYNKGEYAVDANLLKPIFELWYKNDVINNYFLNQLVTGDYSAYASSGAIIKRYAGVKGPRIGPLIDPVVGMSPTFKSLILADNIYTKEDLRKVFSDLLYGDDIPESTPELDEIMAALPDNFKATDAQAFFMPKRVAELSRGYESAWGLGDISKPIYTGLKRIEYSHDTIEGGYSTSVLQYEKVSAVNLRQEMISKFPAMKLLHDIGVKLGVDEIVFGSGFKVNKAVTLDAQGNEVKAPTLKELLAYTDEQILDFRDKWQRNSIEELSNSSYGFQFNAQADPNKQVSIFTQLMYLMNAYPDKLTSELGNTQNAAREMYSLVGELIKSGKEDFFDKIKIPADFVRYLKNNLKGAGSERALQLLNNGISIDNPLIERKAIIALTSGLEKATIKTKFKGGKLVLQTPEGISKYQDPLLFSDIDKDKLESLSYRRETVHGRDIIVAEVIVPKELLTAKQLAMVAQKKSLYLLPDMLGFRIPTTEAHSAVAMRVVGVYSNKQVNMVIAPKELVPIQGQDFDVDALFVITKELVSKSESQVINASAISDYIKQLSQLVLSIHYAETDIDPKFKGYLKRLKEDIKELSGLTKDQSISDEDDTFLDTVSKIYDRIDEIKKDDTSGELAPLYEGFVKTLEDIKSAIVNNVLSPGEEDDPVGYDSVNGKFEIDTNFLQDINDQIKAYEEMTIPSELAGALKGLVKQELKKLYSLKEKYMKNRIIDIMLDIISDRATAARTFTAISFQPLKDVLSTIPTELQASNENFDLSEPYERFKAYLSVSSGESLIGAFANGSKSFGYLARAGANIEGKELFKQITNLRRMYTKYVNGENLTPEGSKIVSDIINKLVNSPEYVTITTKAHFDSILTSLDDFYGRHSDVLSRDKEELPILNDLQVFAIKEGGKTIVYDRMSDIDSDGKNKTTQAYSTLTNAAVDDLNEGYLSKTKINTNTGTAMIGMVALGVPFRYSIKLLYQPILSPLSGGKVSRIDSWIYDLKNGKYGQALEELAHEPLSVEDDLDPFINNASKYSYQNMSINEMLDAMNPEELTSQLKALAVFIKAHKIGSDLKNTASFLDVVRSWDVFLEDIEKVHDKLSDKIGSVYTENGQLVLHPRLDFSFYIPNLFEGADHIKEAYLAHSQILNYVESNFRIHSKPITGIATQVRKLSEVEEEDARVGIYKAKKALQQYLTAGKISSKLKESSVRKYKTYKTVKGKTVTVTQKFLVSGPRAFVDKVAKDIDLVKAFAHANNHDNLFLENIVMTRDKFDLAKLSFRVGVGLKPEDIVDLVTGFKHLNRYEIIDGKVYDRLPATPNEITSLQLDLRDYALLTSGLEYGGSGFSSFMPPNIIRGIDDYANKQLDDLIAKPFRPGIIDHFGLSYNVINAAALPYVPWENISKVEGPDKKYILAGTFEYERVVLDPNTNQVMIVKTTGYYDLKTEVKEGDKVKHNAEYIRREYGKNITVYKKVFETPESTYYQIVGNSKNAIYEPIELDEDYKINDYYNIQKAFVGYSLIDKEKNTILSYSKLLNSLKAGDIMYIYPDYSYDRRDAMEVEIVSKTKSDVNNAVEVTYKEVSLESKIKNILTKAPTAEEAGREIKNLC